MYLERVHSQGGFLTRLRKIKDLPLERRPYEICFHKGPQALTDAELLAVIIRTGVKGEKSTEVAEMVLDYSNNKKGLLNIINLSLNELMQINGIGKVKAAQLKCVAELSKRISKTNAHSNLVFSNPKSIADYYMEELRHIGKECLILMLLNTRSIFIKDIVVSVGTVNASFISSREILIQALKHQAVYMVLVHNHPSGNSFPSKEDIINTKRIKEAGDLIGVSLIDHIIVGDNNFVSLKEKGVI